MIAIDKENAIYKLLEAIDLVSTIDTETLTLALKRFNTVNKDLEKTLKNTQGDSWSRQQLKQTVKVRKITCAVLKQTIKPY